MHSSLIFALTVVCCSIGILVGAYIRNRLPDHHLSPESKETIKIASGLVATLVALVLGLLVGSAKSTFDSTNNALIQDGAQIIILDRAMQRYGHETDALRSALRESLVLAMEKIWPSGRQPRATQHASFIGGIDDMNDGIRSLQPKNDNQRQLQSQMLQLGLDLQQSNWLLVEESQGHLSWIFLMVLIFWMSILFMSFTLLTPSNPSAMGALFISAICTAGAIFLTIEMSSPLHGLIQVSQAPLTNALNLISK